MKNRIIRVLTLAVLCTIGLACHRDCDDTGAWDDGVILGVDYRECVCCGGWFIEIGEDTLRAQVFPDDFEVGDRYPIPVRLRWEPDPTPCLGDEIIVFEIERR